MLVSRPDFVSSEIVLVFANPNSWVALAALLACFSPSRT